MRTINKVIIHCSASDHDEPIEVVKQWHLARGFKDIGYHLYIRVSGALELGRPIEQIGAHCEGWNDHSIGLCLAGEKHFSIEQKKTAKKINQMFYSLLGCTFHPHSEFSKEGKTCPNFDIREVIPNGHLYLV